MAIKTYHSIGLMSGSSLDGLDIAFCKFKVENDIVLNWELLKAETIPFSEMWYSRLAHLPTQSALVYAKTHVYFGHYMGELVIDFMSRNNILPDFISSHGHTIFHHPDKRMTAQIGDGGALAATTGLMVVSDFRTQDIALGGEGTPLAPAADKYLFNGYDFYLNIGGIANISCNANGKMIAFDIGGANQVLFNNKSETLKHIFVEALRGYNDDLKTLPFLEYFPISCSFSFILQFDPKHSTTPVCYLIAVYYINDILPNTVKYIHENVYKSWDCIQCISGLVKFPNNRFFTSYIDIEEDVNFMHENQKYIIN